MDPGTRRNFATYYLNFLVVALVGFIVNPILLGALGPIMFGVWKSLQKYLDFASVADGRASQALKWIVASRTMYSDDERRRDLGAALVVWIRWLPAAALVAAGVTAAVPVLIKGIPEDARTIAFATAAILAANTVLAGLLALPDSVLAGINLGYRSMLITTGTAIVSNAAMVVAALRGWPLWWLAIIVTLAAAINAFLTWLVARRSTSWWGVARPTRQDVRRVFSYSSWTLGWVAVEKLLLAAELIFISVMVGAATVTQYTFTTYVLQFVISISLVTASGFMPLLGAQLGAGDLGAAAERARSVRHLVVGVAAFGCGAILAFNGAFVSFWVGEHQYLGTAVNALLVASGLQLALVRMDGQVLDVTMRIAPKVIVGLFSSVGGIVAGCIAYGLTTSLVAGLVGIILFRLVSNVSYPMLVARSIPGSGLPRRVILFSTVFVILSLSIGPIMQGGSLAVKLGLAMVWLLVGGAFCWLGLLPRDTVRALLAGERK